MQDKMIELQQKIAELKARFPAHSIKPVMLRELEDLEDELEKLRESEMSNDDDR